MSFIKAIAKLIAHEGGFVNHPADKGGPTNWGITQKTFEAWKGRKVSLEEMKSMPQWEAEAIYKKNYWDAFKGDQIRSYPMAYLIFDQAVNSGVGTAVSRAQRVLGVTVDGKMGTNTLSALNTYNEQSFVDQYLMASEANYRGIVANDPTQKVFLNGWLNRISSLESYSLKNLGTTNTIAISASMFLAVGALILVLTTSRAPA